MFFAFALAEEQVFVEPSGEFFFGKTGVFTDGFDPLGGSFQFFDKNTHVGGFLNPGNRWLHIVVILGTIIVVRKNIPRQCISFAYLLILNCVVEINKPP